MREALAGKALRYDKAGEEHYNLISALHKSIRNSDENAAVYWLTRMMHAGEDGNYLSRRLIRIASEDIGLADPFALRIALDAGDAFHKLGYPEGNLALLQRRVGVRPEHRIELLGELHRHSLASSFGLGLSGGVGLLVHAIRPQPRDSETHHGENGEQDQSPHQ